jgi:pyrroline-5-carboxylate reductase
VVGAAAMLANEGQDAGVLRRAVTSPGGTTAAALQVLQERGFAEAMVEAVTAARDRGRELRA